MKAYFREQKPGFLVLLILILSITAVVSIYVGSRAVRIPFSNVAGIIASRLPFPDTWFPAYPDTNVNIVMNIRMPRMLMGLVTGCALAVSGVTMQGIFRNPLASPYILGVSAGGALGASIGIILGLGLYYIPGLAFLIAMLTSLLVFVLGRVNGKTDVPTLLLAGIAVGAFMGATTSYLKFIARESLQNIVFWTMGSLHGSVWEEIYIVMPLVMAGILLTLYHTRELNVLQVGEESAAHLGVEVERTKLILLVLSSLLAASVVAFTGIIGFVGLIIPHIARMLTGPDHRWLVPISTVMGGIFLMSCDILVRLSGNIPVGIITGLFGAPFFLYLLLKNRGGTGW
ncbi:MAG: iron chelate uptake ABC transporter family permease subunit [Thermoplasmata archaeon]